MSTTKLNLPAPYLQGVYLRDDFDFERRGSALEPELPPESLPPKPEPESYRSALMSDEEFLDSITTVSDDAEPGNQKSLFESLAGSSAPNETINKVPTGEPEIARPPIPRNIDKVPRKNRFPFSIPWVEQFDLKFKTAVTFLVGENGSGKSTLIEAIASLSGFPVCGGGRNEMASQFGPERQSELSEAMYGHFTKRPRDGYFFRAEFYAQFATLLDQRARDPDFKEDPYTRYGGKSPHTRSHGESFLDLLNNRLGSGLFLMDEPESALSPQRQLSLLAIMAQRVKSKKTQFIVATHSPILMTFPGATILNLDSDTMEEMTLEETSHYQLTQGILDFPEKYWRHLLDSDSKEEKS